MSSERCAYCDRRYDRSSPRCRDGRRNGGKHPAPTMIDLLVDDLERDLLDRRGIKNELRQCDADIRDEIREAWRKMFRKRLKGIGREVGG